MRVGILLGDSDPTAGGGYTFQKEVFEALLAIGAQARHSFVFLCHPDAAAKLLPSKPLPNAEVVALDVPVAAQRSVLFGRSWPAPRVRSLDEQLQAAGVDFVWQLSAPGQVLEVPYMVVVWDLQHRLQPWFPEVSADGNWQHRENLYSAVLGRAAAVIVGTEVGQREVERFFRVDPSRILILPHPTPRFDDVQATRPVREKYGIAGDYLFYPAQFWAHKNHVNLLLGLELLERRFDKPLNIVFVGADHGNLPHVRATAERVGLAARVHFLGFIPREDLIDLYRQAFALSYVTFFGPENLPPLEAFALGCPVIASDVSGAREQLRDAVLFVDPTSPEQIAEAVMQLANENGLREKLIDAGKKIAQARTPQGFVRGALAFLDRFEAVRRCWA